MMIGMIETDIKEPRQIEALLQLGTVVLFKVDDHGSKGEGELPHISHNDS